MSHENNNTVKRKSPLVGRKDALRDGPTPIERGVSLFERPFLGHISLRGHTGDRAFVDACERTLGAALPVAPNTVSEGEGVVVCWLGPNEWLVLCEADARQAWLDALRAPLADVHSAVTDLSGGQTLIALEGEHAPDVLAKGTTLDVHPRVFGTGQCARTLLAKSTAFIRVIEPALAFEIVVRRSFADYMWQWLIDAAGEYGCQILAPQSSLRPVQVYQPREAVALAAAR